MTFKKIALISFIVLSITSCLKKEAATTATGTGTTSASGNYPEVSVKCGSETCVK